jgi:hypothetical protein
MFGLVFHRSICHFPNPYVRIPRTSPFSGKVSISLKIARSNDLRFPEQDRLFTDARVTYLVWPTPKLDFGHF